VTHTQALGHSLGQHIETQMGFAKWPKKNDPFGYSRLNAIRFAVRTSIRLVYPEKRHSARRADLQTKGEIQSDLTRRRKCAKFLSLAAVISHADRQIVRETVTVMANHCALPRLHTK
jgi:hypothetical protein